MPWAIALIVTLAAWEWHQVSKTRVQPFESWLYDQRVRDALKKEPVTKDIGVVTLDDDSMRALKVRHGWSMPLPRFVYGLVVDDLVTAGASTVVFDMGFGSPGSALHNEQMRKVLGSRVPDGQSSDQFFAESMKRSGMAVFGVHAERGTPPSVPLTTLVEGAHAVGHMRGYADADDVFRRVDPYVLRPDGTRVWQLSIQGVAARLGLNLAAARDEPASWLHGRRLIIPKADGSVLTIPLDEAGQLLVHWSIPFEWSQCPQPPVKPLAAVLSAGVQPPAPTSKAAAALSNRVIFVGSTGELAGRDKANTPYKPVVSAIGVHMNVAASLLSGRFVWTLPDASMFLMLGMIAAFVTYVTWHLRVEWATLSILLLVVCYGWFTDVAYQKWVLVLPMLSPIIGAAGASYLSVLGFRLIVERGRAARVKTLFERLVAPDVIEILMEQRTLPWDTTQRPVTVLFADIRGFTAYTDQQDIQATREIEELKLTGEAAIACRNRYAADSLETVNLYLAIIVDAVKKHGGTLDKYIGDCVMAFWGAPVADSRHASNAVRAAIDAQRQVQALTIEREHANERIAADNSRRLANGEIACSTLPTLSLGIAIHTGEMIVGFMGSERHLSNYTVFGKNVNIAARIEKLADGGRILTTGSTFDAVQTQTPELAKSMTPREEDVGVKGIIEKLTLYEVKS